MTTASKPARQGGSYSKDPKTGKTTLVTRTDPRPHSQDQPSAPETTPTSKKHEEVSHGTV